MKNIKLIIYMLGYIWKADKKGFFWLIVWLIWHIIPTVYRALIYKLIIGSIIEQKSLSHTITIVVLYALVELVARIFSDYVYENRFKRLGLNVKKYSNDLLLQKCSVLDMECYDDTGFYDKISRALGQVDNRAMDVFYQVQRFLSDVIYLITGVAIIVTLDPLMIFVSIAAGIAFFLLDIVFLKTRYQAQEAMIPINRKVDYFHGLMRDRRTVSDIKQYKGFDNYIMGKYNKSADEQIDMSMKLANKEFTHSVKRKFFVVGVYILFPYAYLAVQCFRAVISVADIPAMFNAFNLTVDGFSDISREISNMKESCLYIAHLKEVLEYEPKIERNIGRDIGDIDTIEFDNVSFKYPHSETYVLKDLSITIKKGQKIAIVGINGAGKSTFVKLLMRYYDPCEGRVLVNGVDIKEYSVNALRDKMATLLQEFQPYNVPIDEMIACSETTDEKKVEHVLDEVGLTERINESPKKIKSEYSKMFDEDGIVRSGGELQKLFIARMRYKDGGVYIMDEPSSALDPIAEYEINNLMMNIAKNKTVIMVAHRLSTVVNADCILLIDGGKVLEMGSHKQLLEQNGKYAQMFKLQAEQYQAKNN